MTSDNQRPPAGPNGHYAVHDEPDREAAGRPDVAEAQASDPASAVDTIACQACGAHGDVEPFNVRSLAGGAERTEWSCTDAAACHDRRFPGLAGLLAAGWPGVTTEPAADADLGSPGTGGEAEL